MNTIAERIARRRKELGMTQKELAEKLYVSDKTVSRWETGKQIPDALTVQDIARALDMTVSEIYGMEQDGGNLHESAWSIMHKDTRHLWRCAKYFFMKNNCKAENSRMIPGVFVYGETLHASRDDSYSRRSE